MSKPTPALTPTELASIPPMQNEVNQAEADSQSAQNLREAAKAREEARKK